MIRSHRYFATAGTAKARLFSPNRDPKRSTGSAAVGGQRHSVRQGVSFDSNPRNAIHRRVRRVPRRRDFPRLAGDRRRQAVLAAIDKPDGFSNAPPMRLISASENPPKETFRTFEGHATWTTCAPFGANSGPSSDHMRPICAPNRENAKRGGNFSSKTCQQSEKIPFDQHSQMHALLASILEV